MRKIDLALDANPVGGAKVVQLPPDIRPGHPLLEPDPDGELIIYILPWPFPDFQSVSS